MLPTVRKHVGHRTHANTAHRTAQLRGGGGTGPIRGRAAAAPAAPKKPLQAMKKFQHLLRERIAKRMGKPVPGRKDEVNKYAKYAYGANKAKYAAVHKAHAPKVQAKPIVTPGFRHDWAHMSVSHAMRHAFDITLDATLPTGTVLKRITKKAGENVETVMRELKMGKTITLVHDTGLSARVRYTLTRAQLRYKPQYWALMRVGTRYYMITAHPMLGDRTHVRTFSSAAGMRRALQTLMNNMCDCDDDESSESDTSSEESSSDDSDSDSSASDDSSDSDESDSDSDDDCTCSTWGDVDVGVYQRFVGPGTLPLTMSGTLLSRLEPLKKFHLFFGSK